MTLVSINPVNGREIGRHAEDSTGEIDRKLDAAANAFAEWRKTKGI